MDTISKSIWERPMVVKSLYTGTTIGLGTVSGVALCLHVWLMPIILQHGYSSRTKLDQSTAAIKLGARYLQSSSRAFALAIASLTYIFYHSPDPAVASIWKTCAGVLGLLVTIAPWETFMIFPSNDRLFELKGILDRDKKDNFGDKRDGEIDDLLRSWRVWHTGRVVMPLVATTILTWTAVNKLPLL